PPPPATLRCRPSPERHVDTITTTTTTALLAHEATSARRARRFVDATLRSWACDEVTEVATLLASELVTNALLHAGGAVHVEVSRLPGPGAAEGQGGGEGGPTVRAASERAGAERGLAGVDEADAAWGARLSRHGKPARFAFAVNTAETAGTAG